MTFKERLAAIPGIGTLMAVQKRTKADAADQFGAAIAFHGFISLFPLIAVAVAIAGWLLSDQPEQIDNVVSAIQAAVPGLDSAAIDSVLAGIINNAGSIGLIGFLGALYTGLRVTTAAHTSTQFVFGVRLEEVQAIKARARQLGSLALLGVMALGSVALSAWVQSVVLSELSGPFAGLVPFGAWLASAFLSVLLFWTAYRIYSAGSGLGWRQLLPGALVGGVGWAGLQYFGGAYLARQADSSVLTEDGSSATAVLLATMIGLMLLFYLAGRLYVYGAELSAVLADVPNRATREAELEEEARSPDPAPRPTPARATEQTSGDQQGLLAALTAHEQRRGLPPPDDTASLFPVAADTEEPGSDEDGEDAASQDEESASDPAAPSRSAGDSDDASRAGSGAGSAAGAAAVAGAGLLGRRGRKRRRRGPDEVADDPPAAVDDDLVVTIDHDPVSGATDSGDAPGTTTSTIDGPDPARAGTDAVKRGDGSMTRALVPFAPPGDGDSAPSLVEDPAVRRVAAAAAVGLVGLAVGAIRWRRQD